MYSCVAQTQGEQAPRTLPFWFLCLESINAVWMVETTSNSRCTMLGFCVPCPGEQIPVNQSTSSWNHPCCHVVRVITPMKTVALKCSVQPGMLQGTGFTVGYPLSTALSTAGFIQAPKGAGCALSREG